MGRYKRYCQYLQKEPYLPHQTLSKDNILTEIDKMADAFNEFFVNIGNSVEKKIPIGAQCFSNYLNDSVPNSIFLTPV